MVLSHAWIRPFGRSHFNTHISFMMLILGIGYYFYISSKFLNFQRREPLLKEACHSLSRSVTESLSHTLADSKHLVPQMMHCMHIILVQQVIQVIQVILHIQDMHRQVMQVMQVMQIVLCRSGMSSSFRSCDAVMHIIQVKESFPAGYTHTQVTEAMLIKEPAFFNSVHAGYNCYTNSVMQSCLLCWLSSYVFLASIKVIEVIFIKYVKQNLNWWYTGHKCRLFRQYRSHSMNYKLKATYLTAFVGTVRFNCQTV